MEKEAPSELLRELRAGKRLWQSPGETKDALVRFQRAVVLPLRHLASSGALKIREFPQTYRGATFVPRVEVTELSDSAFQSATDGF